MCSPLPPEVFGHPTAPSSSSTSCATLATRRTVSNPHCGMGSRSIRHSSGRSVSARRGVHGLKFPVDSPASTHRCAGMPQSDRRELAPEMSPPMLARRRALLRPRRALLRPPDTRREREPALAGTRAKAWHCGRRSARREPESDRDIERVRVEPDYPAAIVAALRVGAAGRRRIAQRPEHAVVVGETNETTMAPYLVATDEQPAPIRDTAHERVSGAWHIHLMEPADVPSPDRRPAPGALILVKRPF